PLPPPVSPHIYMFLGGLNRGDNSLVEIFPENFWVGGGEGCQKVKKNSPKIFRNREKRGNDRKKIRQKFLKIKGQC
ncbi:MAG: hypothetical protein EBX50_17260, partial [Chitinophagia bacterium]|nr:hypothetical protein [Chitinophagia bacterium]